MLAISGPVLRTFNRGLCVNFSTNVIQEVPEFNFDLHAGAGVLEPRATSSGARRNDLLDLRPKNSRAVAQPVGSFISK
jgi:hypothetical protein